MSVAERREREREERRNLILNAAEQVFHRRGLDLSTMDDIAGEAQLGKGTLYLYFRTKEELLLALGVRRQQAMLKSFEAVRAEARDGLSMLRGLFLAYAERMSSPVEHLRMMMARWASATPFDATTRGGEEMLANVRSLFGTVHEAIDRGMDDGSIRPHREPAKLAVHLWACVNGALLMQLAGRCMPPDGPLKSHLSTVEEHIDFLMAGIRARPSLPAPLVVTEPILRAEGALG